ncbi:hypothetical protein [Moritella sp.]|uniref:hypothetical protein n=1 Tax=Moritella sp. TaxID=78556 RepID=UPI001DE72510|nr:hypothetical protein [Moritella sp.]MCJ8352264.1 hypothetical protein [Moritella sp.]NQZ42505.1 hypothetical protein [Moritella sp.]
MEYIKRGVEPTLLKDNKIKWTKSWVDFYEEKKDKDGGLIKDKKPNDSHWLNDKVRFALILTFKNNCGYCGCSRPTPRRETDSKISPRGHVDHYRAKAIHPRLTYEWTNYIWSCESCNTEKGEFDNPEYPILNPCDLKDCNQLEFIIDTGEYCLANNQKPYDLRFKNTDISTMLNAKEISVQRRNRVKTFKSFFNTISTLLKVGQNKLCEPLINQHIRSIKDDLEDHNFYFLIQKEQKLLREKYPEVTRLLECNGI